MAAGITFQNGSYLSGSASSSTLTTSGGVTASSLYNTDYLDNKYEYTDTKESYEIAYSGRDAAINTDISNITSYISNGQEDKVIAAYQSLLNEMKNQERYSQLVGEDGDDTQLRAVARDLIESQTGVDLEQYIRENTQDQAGVEFQNVLTWGNCDSTSQEELLKELCNLEEDPGHGNPVANFFAMIASPFVVGFNELFHGGKKM